MVKACWGIRILSVGVLGFLRGVAWGSVVSALGLEAP